MDNGCHDVQDLCLPRIGDVSAVVNQNCLQEWWDHAGIDHLQIVCFLNVRINKLQYFLLDRSKSSDFGCFGGDIA